MKPFHSKPLLAFTGLRKLFGGHTVLNGVSGEIHPGEVILLRGDNGAGKTTLLNILSGCLEPDFGKIELSVNGEVVHFEFPRTWIKNLNPWNHFTPDHVARHGVSRVWQDVRLFPSLRLAENISAADQETDDSPWSALFRRGRTLRRDGEARKRAVRSLDTLGLGGRGASSGDKISLGQSKRVAISRALTTRGRLLLLDEPLSGLDSDGIGDAIAMLQDLVRRNQLALVIVEHALNAHHLAPLVTQIWDLNEGKLRVLPADAPSAATVRPFWRDPEFLADFDVSRYPIERGALLIVLRRPRSKNSLAPEVLFQVNKIRVGRGGRLVLGHDGSRANDGLSFEIRDGEIAVLEAPNGWGKSTLFELITRGDVQPDSGEILFQRAEPPAFSDFREQRIRALSSDSLLFPSLKLSELAKLSGVKDDPFLMSSAYISQLSGGELRRAGISATGRGRLTVYDEVFHSLDETSVRRTRKTLIDSPDPETAFLFLEPYQADGRNHSS